VAECATLWPEMSGTRERPPAAPPEEAEAGPEAQTRTRDDAAKTAGATGKSPDEARRGALVDMATLEQVIHRATELQIASPAPGAEVEGLTEAELLQVAEDIGLEPRFVRQALRETRAEAVRPEVPIDKGVLARIYGERFVRASRTVPGKASALQTRLEFHLRDAESLTELQRRPGRSVWTPAQGLASRIQRGLNIGRRAYLLARAEKVQLSVMAVDDETSVVTLVVDVGNLRARQAQGWAAASAFLLAPGTFLATWLMGLPPEFAAVTGVTVGGATAITAGRVGTQQDRHRMQMVVDGLLDRLERGEALESLRPSWRDLLRSP
jgi:hypothetical protein